MKKMRVMIADQSLLSRKMLSDFIKILPEYEVVAEASNGEELIEMIMQEKPDICLTDIDMPDLDGFETIKACKQFIPELQIIIATANPEYAVEAFNISAADYIMKPVAKDRLLQALDKAKQLIELRTLPDRRTLQNKLNKLSIKTNNMFLYLPLEDILYIEKKGRKTIIHTPTSQFATTESLQEFHSKLPESFYMTHRSYLVSLEKIVKIEPSGETFLTYFTGTDKQAYISKLKINEVRDMLGA